eukprot:14342646-Alexandrium_andersonii.AAC.1
MKGPRVLSNPIHSSSQEMPQSSLCCHCMPCRKVPICPLMPAGRAMATAVHLLSAKGWEGHSRTVGAHFT